jgi:hypothetical protein
MSADRLSIQLATDQQAPVTQALHQDAEAIDLKIEELEQRIAPGGAEFPQETITLTFGVLR